MSNTGATSTARPTQESRASDRVQYKKKWKLCNFFTADYAIRKDYHAENYPNCANFHGKLCDKKGLLCRKLFKLCDFLWSCFMHVY